MHFLLAEAPVAGQIVKTAITGVDMSGVLGELTSLIPVVLPVAISFLAVRKGISFLMGTLQNA